VRLGLLPKWLLVRPVRGQHILRGRHRNIVHGVPEWPDVARGLNVFVVVRVIQSNVCDLVLFLPNM
jgi:hypothetical protein